MEATQVLQMASGSQSGVPNWADAAWISGVWCPGLGVAYGTNVPGWAGMCCSPLTETKCECSGWTAILRSVHSVGCAFPYCHQRESLEGIICGLVFSSLQGTRAETVDRVW